eukprot:jgi/Botrbrau1/22347/Bobra.0002s0025.1
MRDNAPQGPAAAEPTLQDTQLGQTEALPMHAFPPGLALHDSLPPTQVDAIHAAAPAPGHAEGTSKGPEARIGTSGGVISHMFHGDDTYATHEQAPASVGLETPDRSLAPEGLFDPQVEAGFTTSRSGTPLVPRVPEGSASPDVISPTAVPEPEPQPGGPVMGSPTAVPDHASLAGDPTSPVQPASGLPETLGDPKPNAMPGSGEWKKSGSTRAIAKSNVNVCGEPMGSASGGTGTAGSPASGSKPPSEEAEEQSSKEGAAEGDARPTPSEQRISLPAVLRDVLGADDDDSVWLPPEVPSQPSQGEVDSPHPVGPRATQTPDDLPGAAVLPPRQDTKVHNQPQTEVGALQTVAVVQEDDLRQASQGFESHPTTAVQNEDSTVFVGQGRAASDVSDFVQGAALQSPGIGVEAPGEAAVPTAETSSGHRTAARGHAFSGGSTMKDSLLAMLAEGATDDDDDASSEGEAGASPSEINQRKPLPVEAMHAKARLPEGTGAGSGVLNKGQPDPGTSASRSPGDCPPIPVPPAKDTQPSAWPLEGVHERGGKEPGRTDPDVKALMVPEGASPGSGLLETVGAKSGANAPTGVVEALPELPQGEDSDLTAPEVGLDAGDPEVSSPKGTQGTAGTAANSGGAWVTRKKDRAEFLSGLTLVQLEDEDMPSALPPDLAPAQGLDRPQKHTPQKLSQDAPWRRKRTAAVLSGSQEAAFAPAGPAGFKVQPGGSPGIPANASAAAAVRDSGPRPSGPLARRHLQNNDPSHIPDSVPPSAPASLAEAELVAEQAMEVDVVSPVVPVNRRPLEGRGGGVLSAAPVGGADDEEGPLGPLVGVGGDAGPTESPRGLSPAQRAGKATSTQGRRGTRSHARGAASPVPHETPPLKMSSPGHDSGPPQAQGASAHSTRRGMAKSEGKPAGRSRGSRGSNRGTAKGGSGLSAGTSERKAAEHPAVGHGGIVSDEGALEGDGKEWGQGTHKIRGGEPRSSGARGASARDRGASGAGGPEPRRRPVRGTQHPEGGSQAKVGDREPEPVGEEISPRGRVDDEARELRQKAAGGGPHVNQMGAGPDQAGEGRAGKRKRTRKPGSPAQLGEEGGGSPYVTGVPKQAEAGVEAPVPKQAGLGEKVELLGDAQVPQHAGDLGEAHLQAGVVVAEGERKPQLEDAGGGVRAHVKGPGQALESPGMPKQAAGVPFTRSQVLEDIFGAAPAGTAAATRVPPVPPRPAPTPGALKQYTTKKKRHTALAQSPGGALGDPALVLHLPGVPVKTEPTLQGEGSPGLEPGTASTRTPNVPATQPEAQRKTLTKPLKTPSKDLKTRRGSAGRGSHMVQVPSGSKVSLSSAVGVKKEPGPTLPAEASGLKPLTAIQKASAGKPGKKETRGGLEGPGLDPLSPVVATKPSSRRRAPTGGVPSGEAPPGWRKSLQKRPGKPCSRMLWVRESCPGNASVKLFVSTRVEVTSRHLNRNGHR